MGLRKNRHEEVRRFMMRQRMVAIGDDYWIEDDNGDRVFKVNGKVARVRDTWELEDPDGSRVVQFKIYDAPVGGRAVWNGEVQNHSVNGGHVIT